jgi:hypothetical protein
MKSIGHGRLAIVATFRLPLKRPGRPAPEANNLDQLTFVNDSDWASVL